MPSSSLIQLSYHPGCYQESNSGAFAICERFDILCQSLIGSNTVAATPSGKGGLLSLSLKKKRQPLREDNSRFGPPMKDMYYEKAAEGVITVVVC